MSKEKKNRFYYSEKQNNIDEEVWDMPTRFTFVKTPDGWKQYSEWCSVKGVKCNWEDAELVYETDEEPEIIVHSEIPEFINEQQAKIADLEIQLSLTEKALEYVCKKLVELKGMNCSEIKCNDSCMYGGCCKDIEKVMDYFKTKAKEII